MITPSQIIDLGYQIVDGSPLPAAITGEVYKVKRALNSAKEDVVINTLSVSNDQLQQGVMNINIHVPNIRLGNGPTQDGTRPDFVRMNQLTELFKPLFNDEIFISDTVFYLQSIGFVPEENLQEQFVNFRIIFYSKNVR